MPGRFDDNPAFAIEKRAGPASTRRPRRKELPCKQRRARAGRREAGPAIWWRREDSNLRHGAYETPALPPELRRLGRNYAQLQSGILTRPIAGARRIVPGAGGVRTPARTWRAGGGAAAPPPGGARRRAAASSGRARRDA